MLQFLLQLAYREAGLSSGPAVYQHPTLCHHSGSRDGEDGYVSGRGLLLGIVCVLAMYMHVGSILPVGMVSKTGGNSWCNY